MFPTITDSIGRRELGDRWDRLAIVANCCQYPIRLKKEELQQKSCSLGLSMLSLCLLNGEIIDNGKTEKTDRSPPLTRVNEYLRTQFFNKFHGPQIDRSLTFNKSCRFINVKLNAHGIMTEGHLWKLGRIIRTVDFPDQLPQLKKLRSSLTVHQRRRLAQLASELRSLSHVPLACSIEDYLRLDSSNNGRSQPWRSDFPRRYMRMAAKMLVEAIDRGETLRLGSLWGCREALTPYQAVFIWEDGDDSQKIHANQQEVPSFVFTASRPKQPNSSSVGTNDIDHHVSLEVRFADLDLEHRVPQLYVRRWLSGLCFFKRCPRSNVIFPWPPPVETLTPR